MVINIESSRDYSIIWEEFKEKLNELISQVNLNCSAVISKYSCKKNQRNLNCKIIPIIYY